MEINTRIKENYALDLPVSSVGSQWVAFIMDLQQRICSELELVDNRERFISDEWRREGGGGGQTNVLSNGKVFEKGGVNTSVVGGEVTDVMSRQLKINGHEWFACGISLVLHPVNPFVPTVHANFRYFELYGKDREITDRWFGGGADLTPYYLFEEDAGHFHQTFQKVCAAYGDELYPRFKKWCDEYFVNKHRGNEARGIGGIFYDYLRPDGHYSLEDLFSFSKANGNAFLKAYLPIVQKRKHFPYDNQHKRWQEIRRGRYVEFNLLHDRGTVFGLKSNGRTESILMSLPPTVRFEYDDRPDAGSDEWKLLEVLKQPREWA